jgi:SAM-dependent methyltransferase
MTHQAPATRWEQRYREGDIPWDKRCPESQLIEAALELDWPAPLALDLGCGTGDNAMALAERSYEAIGLDVSGTAIAIAKQRATDAGLDRAKFICCDVLQPLPVERPAGLVIDRGCYHVFEETDRVKLAERVAGVLAPDGYWIMLCGNADEQRGEGQEGPPQLTAGQVIGPVEHHFIVERLEQARFTGSDGHPTHLAWRVVLRRRPANP